MKALAKNKHVSFWLVLILALFASVVFYTNDTNASCPGNYCYDYGTNPRGGECGKSDHDGAWWDTCFGLSWQYYEWPANVNTSISFHGTENSGGAAEVDAKCKDYGGFWFLGYEVYNPKTKKSYGYQVAKPKVSMLSAAGGRAPLYPYDGAVSGATFTPSINKYNNLKGVKYGTYEDVRSLFLGYVDNDESTANGNQTDFSQVNWFCARPGDDIEVHRRDDDGGDGDEQSTPTSYARGRSVVKLDSKTWERTAWSVNGDVVRLALTLEEGDSQDVTFKHRLVAKGSYAQDITYSIVDSANTTLLDGVYNYDGESMDKSVVLYSEPITVSQTGSYCQTLTISYMRPIGAQMRTSTSCIDVKVVPRPPKVFGRVEVTVGDQTLSSDWNSGVEDPAIIDVTIQEGETADVSFADYLKAYDGDTAKIKYETSNSYYIGKTLTGYYEYSLDQANIEREVGSNSVDKIGKSMTICETLHFSYDGASESAEACARITLNKGARVISDPEASSKYISFSAIINPYLSLTTDEASLKTNGGINELLRVSTGIHVVTNNITGYTATISSNKSSADENVGKLHNTSSNTFIPGLVSPVARKDFPINYWGFSFNDSEDGDPDSIYRALAASDSNNVYVFGESDEPTEDDYDVYFATMADISKASGSYSAGVSVKAVASVVPSQPSTINELHYMQDITDDIVNTMVVNQQYKLYDRRDNKGYWVTKLESGEVIMTQNLDFVLKKGDCLYGGDSDVKEVQGVARCLAILNDTSTSLEETWLSPNPEARTANQTYQYDYYAGIVEDEVSYYRSYRPASDEDHLGKTVTLSAEDDSGVHTMNVTIGNYLVNGTTPMYYASSSECASANAVSVETCEHWQAGVYYQMKAARNLGNSYENNTGVGSICPERWTLPSTNDLSTVMLTGYEMETLLSAPYYMVQSGIFTYRNVSVKYSQWYMNAQSITYLSYDDYIVAYPYSNINYDDSYSYGNSVSNLWSESYAVPARCVVKKGY